MLSSYALLNVRNAAARHRTAAPRPVCLYPINRGTPLSTNHENNDQTMAEAITQSIPAVTSRAKIRIACSKRNQRVLDFHIETGYNIDTIVNSTEVIAS